MSGRLQMRAAATIKTNAVYPVGVMDHGRCVEACLCAGAHSWLMLRSFAGLRRRKPKQTGRYALSFPFALCQIRNPRGGGWSAISLVTSKGKARGQQLQETQTHGRHACSVGLARLPETAGHASTQTNSSPTTDHIQGPVTHPADRARRPGRAIQPALRRLPAHRR